MFKKYKREAAAHTEQEWSAMPLAHHWEEDYHRCTLIGKHHVCSRCLVSWPTALLAVILTMAGIRWPESWDLFMLLVLPAPAVADFAFEQLGGKYHPKRQLLSVIPCAYAFGVGLARYYGHPTDPVFWGVTLFYGIVCMGLIVYRSKIRN